MTAHTSNSASDRVPSLASELASELAFNLAVDAAVDGPASGLLCYYTNSSPQTQIVQLVQASLALADLAQRNPVTPIPKFERVVFPGERLLFQASAGATLEVQSQTPTGELIVERLLCDRLACHETASCFPTTLL